jgi:hypothetical protein
MAPKGIMPQETMNLQSSPGSECDFEMKKIETLMPSPAPAELLIESKNEELLGAKETTAIAEELLGDPNLIESTLNETQEEALRETFKET